MKAFTQFDKFAGLVLGFWIGAGLATAPAALPGTVLAWGTSFRGITNVPPGLTNVTAVAAGSLHSLALKDDGTVVAWGDNSYGQTSVPPGLSNVTAIAAGEMNSAALLSNGTAVAWGSYFWSGGKTEVPQGLTGLKAIAVGFSLSVALRNDGSVVGWSDSQPLTETGASNVTAIATGLHSALYLRSNGTLVGWGGLGCNSTGLTNVTAIASSSGHHLALKGDGTVVACGYDDYGQTDVPIGLSNVVAIAAGGVCDYDCLGGSAALKSDGTVVGWGARSYVPPGLSNVTAVAVGAHHTLVIVGTPIPPPTLHAEAVGNHLILSWPTNAAGFTLESTLDLATPDAWFSVTNPPMVSDLRYVVTNVFKGSARFYRLKKP